MGGLYDYEVLDLLYVMEGKDEGLEVVPMYDARMTYNERKDQWLKRMSAKSL
jgi:hypothetical protein